jgi:hypothetical protein
MKILKLILIGILAIGALSCSKMEGYGGKATIRGKVYGKDFTTNGNLVSEGYLGDVRVFIAKHGTTNYFDDVRTAYDGSFQFEFLQKGKYDLWSFGDCNNCTWDQVYDLITVEITEKNEIVVAPNIELTF